MNFAAQGNDRWVCLVQLSQKGSYYSGVPGLRAPSPSSETGRFASFTSWQSSGGLWWCLFFFGALPTRYASPLAFCCKQHLQFAAVENLVLLLLLLWSPAQESSTGDLDITQGSHDEILCVEHQQQRPICLKEGCDTTLV